MLNRIIIALSLLLGSQVVLAQDQYKEGVHYTKIDQPATQMPAGEVQVTEVFSYGCSHCNTFEPYMQAWIKNKPTYVKLNRLPVSFGRKAWEIMAHGYVTAEVMSIAKESHPAMMDAVWKEGKQFRSPEDLADFYSAFGVKKDAFIASYNSFAVDSIMRKNQRDVGVFGITGTPTLVVDGQYRIQGNTDVPGFEDMLKVANYLIEIEHAQATEQSSGR